MFDWVGKLLQAKNKRQTALFQPFHPFFMAYFLVR
jgi:hypothetical protein